MASEIILSLCVRILLLIGCSVTIYYQINNLWQLLQFGRELRYFADNSAAILYTNYAAACSMILLALIGAHGTCMKPRLLNIFALFACLYAIVLFVAPLHWQYEAIQYVKEMRASARSEDDYGFGTAWASFQTTHRCCGLRAPSDWWTLGGTKTPGKALPSSCCDEFYCYIHSRSLYEEGCARLLMATRYSRLPMPYFEPLWYLMLSALSLLILLKSSPNDDHSLIKLAGQQVLEPLRQRTKFVRGKLTPMHIIPMPWYITPAQEVTLSTV